MELCVQAFLFAVCVCVFVCVEIFINFEKLSVVIVSCYKQYVLLYPFTVIVRFISSVNSVIIKGTSQEVNLYRERGDNGLVVYNTRPQSFMITFSY